MVAVVIRALGELLSAEVAEVVAVVVRALGEALAAEVAEMVAVVIRALGELLAAEVAEVIAVVVRALGQALAAEVAEVVAVVIRAVGQALAAEVAEVVAVVVRALGQALSAEVAEVVAVVVRAVGELLSAEVAEVVAVVICALGEALAAEVAEVVTVGVCALGEALAAEVAEVVTVVIRANAERSAAGVARMVAVRVRMRRFVRRRVAGRAGVPVRALVARPVGRIGVRRKRAVGRAAGVADGTCGARRRAAGAGGGLGVGIVALADAGVGIVAVCAPSAPVMVKRGAGRGEGRARADRAAGAGGIVDGVMRAVGGGLQRVGRDDLAVIDVGMRPARGEGMVGGGVHPGGLRDLLIAQIPAVKVVQVARRGGQRAVGVPVTDGLARRIDRAAVGIEGDGVGIAGVVETEDELAVAGDDAGGRGLFGIEGEALIGRQRRGDAIAGRAVVADGGDGEVFTGLLERFQIVEGIIEGMRPGRPARGEGVVGGGVHRGGLRDLLIAQIPAVKVVARAGGGGQRAVGRADLDGLARRIDRAAVGVEGDGIVRLRDGQGELRRDGVVIFGDAVADEGIGPGLEVLQCERGVPAGGLQERLVFLAFVVPLGERRAAGAAGGLVDSAADGDGLALLYLEGIGRFVDGAVVARDVAHAAARQLDVGDRRVGDAHVLNAARRGLRRADPLAVGGHIAGEHAAGAYVQEAADAAFVAGLDEVVGAGAGAEGQAVFIALQVLDLAVVDHGDIAAGARPERIDRHAGGEDDIAGLMEHKAVAVGVVLIQGDLVGRVVVMERRTRLADAAVEFCVVPTAVGLGPNRRGGRLAAEGAAVLALEVVRLVADRSAAAGVALAVAVLAQGGILQRLGVVTRILRGRDARKLVRPGLFAVVAGAARAVPIGAVSLRGAGRGDGLDEAHPVAERGKGDGGKAARDLLREVRVGEDLAAAAALPALLRDAGLGAVGGLLFMVHLIGHAARRGEGEGDGIVAAAVDLLCLEGVGKRLMAGAAVGEGVGEGCLRVPDAVAHVAPEVDGKGDGDGAVGVPPAGVDVRYVDADHSAGVLAALVGAAEVPVRRQGEADAAVVGLRRGRRRDGRRQEGERHAQKEQERKKSFFHVVPHFQCGSGRAAALAWCIHHDYSRLPPTMQEANGENREGGRRAAVAANEK